MLYIDPTWAEDVRSLRDKVRSIAPERSGLGLRELVPGSLWVYTYHYAPPLGWRLNQRNHRRVLHSLAKRLHFPAPVAVAFRPDAPLKLFQPEASLYYAVDEQTAYGGILPEWQRRIRAQEEMLLRDVDVALGVSPRLVHRFRKLQPRSYVLENGVDPEHFAPERLARLAGLPEIQALPAGPRLGFVGQIDERIDQPLLLHLARERPEWQIVLMGRVKEGTDVSALRAEPNVHFVPFQPYDRLPNALREIDVCLVPYRSTLLTESCNPAKIFEYIATGKPVVSTPLEGIQAARGVIRLAGSAGAFLSAVDAALADPGAGREERLQVAADSHWEHRVDEMERRLEEAREAARHPQGVPNAVLRSLPSRGLAKLPGPPERWQEHGWRAEGSPFPSALSRVAWEAFRAAGLGYYGVRLTSRLLRGKGPLTVRSILVVRRTFLGDTIVFLPTLAALRERYPHARIVLGVQPGMSAGALLEGTGYVDEIRTLDFLSRPSLAARVAGAVRLWAEGFDVTISGLGYYLLAEGFYTGSPRRVGLYDGHPGQRLNTRSIPQDVTTHEAANNLALVELLSGVRIEPAPVPELVLDPVATEGGGEGLLADLGVPAGAGLLVVHPGAKRASRRWPADRFAELIAELLTERPELWAVFSGVADEAELVEGIRAALPAAVRNRAPSSIGRTDLPALIGLLDRSDLVISNDTGTMHLARARGAQLLALLGPESHRRWGPHPVGSAPAVALRYEVPCAPCSREACQLHVCLRSLPVAEVLAEARKLLERGRSAESGHTVEVTHRIHRRSWRMLAEAGFELPLVSVVAFVVDAETHAAALAAVEQQDYPRLEVIVVTPEGCLTDAGTEGIAGHPVRRVHVAPNGPADTRPAVLQATGGDFVAIWTPGAKWQSGKLAAEVAALVRDPEAATAAGAILPRVGISPGDSTMRRAVLESMLARAGEADPSTSQSLSGGLSVWIAAMRPAA